MCVIASLKSNMRDLAAIYRRVIKYSAGDVRGIPDDLVIFPDNVTFALPGYRCEGIEFVAANGYLCDVHLQEHDRFTRAFTRRECQRGKKRE